MTEVSRSTSQDDVDALLGLEPSLRSLSRSRWTKLAVGALVVAIAGLLVLRSGANGSAIQYLTQPASRGELRVIVTATGSVVPTNQVDVSSELSGTVRRVWVDFNDRVKAGQLLAELDTDRLVASVESSRATLEAARARVEEARATLNEAELEHERQRSLAASKFSSAQALERARATYERARSALASARAQVGVAQAELKVNETNLTKASIHSPVDGVVLVRNVNPGQTVAATLQAPVLFSIAEDLTQMEVEVAVDEADVGQVATDQRAELSVDAYPERRFPATIRELRFAPETVQGVVTYKAVLAVDNSELLLRPGMTATAEITVQEISDAVLVPNEALRFSPPARTAEDEGSWVRRIMPRMPRFRDPSAREPSGPVRSVWLLRDGAPVAIDVEVGPSDGRSTQIVKGELAEGEPVIVDAVTPAGS